jgi:glycosyltransferase involved in cell wall biosynthesis
MKLSILICSLESRSRLLESLKSHLQKQIGTRGEQVEIITYVDKRERSTGFKRQWLLNQAHGNYVVFIDDDDWVYDYYIDEMLKACESGCDCFAINGIMTTDGRHETKWFISRTFDNVSVVAGNKTIYNRKTNHITGVKREIALRAGFPDKSNAEDKYYSDRLQTRTEFKIEKPMYIYRFSTYNKQYK